jgi:hypothetical protein
MSEPTLIMMRAVAEERDRNNAFARRSGDPIYYLIWFLGGAAIPYEALWKALIGSDPPR